MAKASKYQVTVVKTIKSVEERVEIILTKDEAETLLAIMRRVGGPPTGTRREHADAINTALREAGVKIIDDYTHSATFNHQKHGIRGTIHCEEPT